MACGLFSCGRRRTTSPKVRVQPAPAFLPIPNIDKRHSVRFDAEADTQPARELKPPKVSRTASLLDFGPTGGEITEIEDAPFSQTGNFSDVYKGKHSVAGTVALKRPRGYVSEDIVRRFRREAAQWQKLDHPNVLQFLGLVVRGGHLYLVSPFVRQGTLVNYLQNNPDTNRIVMLCQLADAIRYLHSADIIHGDIKGNNVLVGDEDQVLLTDFGLSRPVSDNTSRGLRGCGTARWQAPELLDNVPKSYASDTYAYGITIAEVLTGQNPFPHLTSDSAVIVAVITRNERPERVPTESPKGLSYQSTWDVAAACWPRDPGQRITMEEAFRRMKGASRRPKSGPSTR